jgi:urocanate hydratase
MINNLDIEKNMVIKLENVLPEKNEFIEGIRRAPKRELTLTEDEISLAVENALRYIPQRHHEIMAEEFLEELLTMGRIYGYRFRPEGNIYGKPIDQYNGKCVEGKAIQVMIDNNLDFDVALYPYELVTYGETGQVCQNWMQYALIKKYLENLTHEQTLVISSGHPLGLFKSKPDSPRVTLTNGIMVGKYDDPKNWSRAAAMGVTNYGQFTAGGWFYIGSQGIVHGTFSTLMSIGREILGISKNGDLKGKLFVTAGLGGMSGAQGKAVELANGVGIIAEVDYSRIKLRKDLGWIKEIAVTPEEAFDMARQHINENKSTSIAYYGNIIDLLEYAVEKNEKIDILTDQTSCHVVYDGGYCPSNMTYEERTELLKNDKSRFEEEVKRTLRRHFELIEILRDKGVYFFDYGNSLTTSIYELGIKEVCVNGENDLNGFKYKSFVEAFVGPILFDYGYGPFRWVCLSGSSEELRKTDNAAMHCIDRERRFQDYDNYLWIKNAEKYDLVIGTQARILYQDAETRIKIALKFNDMVRQGIIGPIMIGRDHFDAGGVDSPSRETSNIKDGSNITGDMTMQTFGGATSRGMTMVTLHNGGGTGIGNSLSCGYGLVLDGSERVNEIIGSAISYDVIGGVARRAWARNKNSLETVMTHNSKHGDTDHVTLPYLCDKNYIDNLVKDKMNK